MNRREAQLRLNDPDGHFPYKLDAALGAIRANAPAGPEGADDDRANVRDYLSEDIAYASEALVKAQAEFLQNGNEDNRVKYTQAKEALVEARRAHRANRDATPNVVAVRSPL